MEDVGIKRYIKFNNLINDNRHYTDVLNLILSFLEEDINNLENEIKIEIKKI